MNKHWVAVLIAITALIVLVPNFSGAAEKNGDDADILVVGAGLAGLSAALEAARDGVTVTVLDTASVLKRRVPGASDHRYS